MSDYAIQVRGLGKQYRIGASRASYRTLREMIVRAVRSPLQRAASVLAGRSARGEIETIWALKDVTFEVKPGEVVGVIGPNGAGKTTLLKILSRITKPTAGTVDLYGRVGSLLEVGTGFHPELTGRENVYLNGAILGMSRSEIDRKFGEIIEFSGISQFSDTAVKHYSSGMYVRLAFAVAAHLEPEILLVDEVLSVGDAAFQKKSLGKMGEISSLGRTVFLVSHNMAAIENLCDRAMFFDSGELIAFGDVIEVIQTYMKSNLGRAEHRVNLIWHDSRPPDFSPVLTGIELFGNGVPSATVGMGEALEIRLQINNSVPIWNVGIAVEDIHGQRLFVASPVYQQPDLLSDGVRKAGVICRIPKVSLLPGVYYISVNASSKGSMIDRVDRAATLTVVERDVFNTGKAPGKGKGVFFVDATWSLIDPEPMP